LARHDAGYDLDPTLPPEGVGTRVCSNCHRRVPGDARRCPLCSFDPKSGLDERVYVGGVPLGKDGLTCQQCGYIMRGASAPRCPECGAVAEGRSVRMTNARYSRDVAREAYRTPLIMLAVALPIIVFGQAALGGWVAGAIALLSYAVQVPVGVAVFWLCCLIWVGFDAPMHLTALRLAAIYSVVDLTIIVAGIALPGLIAFVIGVVLYIGLLSQFLEMEFTDAIIVGFVTFVAKIVIVMAIVAMVI